MRSSVTTAAGLLALVPLTFSQSTWQSELLYATGGIGSDHDVVVGPDGALHVSFEYEHAFVPGSDLYYGSKQDPGSPWIIDVAADDPFDFMGDANDIALDALGRPHISYTYEWDFTFTPFINHSFFDGAAWQTTTLTAPSTNPNTGSAVEVDDSGLVHVVYGQSEAGLIHAVSSGGGFVTVDQLNNPGRAEYPKLALRGDEVFIAYIHRKSAFKPTNLKLAHYDGSSWSISVVHAGDLFNTPDIDLDLDSAGNPHIVYSVFESPSPTVKLMHAWTDGVAWSSEELYNVAPHQGWNGSLAIGADDTLHVSFSRWLTNVERSLMYMRRQAGGAWTTEVVEEDGTSFQPWQTAIAVDLAGLPHIIFHERISRETRHTWMQPAPAASYCTAGTSAAGCAATLGASGVPSATAASGFTLTASAADAQRSGLFFFGTNGRQANPWGNGTSLQCVTPPVMRAALLTSTGTPGACDGAFAQDLNARWTAKPAQNPGPGALVQAQLWYRDPQNTSNQTTGLSDALEFLVGP